jgi:hypothetical protein
MRYAVPLVVTLSITALAGCSVGSRSKVQPEAVRFDHPDEVVNGEGFIVLADRREFAVMAFLNATGYDEEAQGQQMHPVRVKVREMVTANLAEHPEKVKAWRAYRNGLIRKHLQTFHYQDFALSLSTDYPFQRIRPDDELSYSITAGQLRDFPEVLNDFWTSAKLAAVWDRVKPEYVTEIQKYNFERMKRRMGFLWTYLRMPRHDTLTLVSVPNLLDSHFEAIGARYEGFYYSVESPGSHDYDLNIHEYLHSVVNPLVREDFGAQQAKLAKYCQACKNRPFGKTYGSPVTFTFESLVRALDHRLAVLQTNDPADKRRIEGQVAWETEKGLTLVQPFYNLLAEFEQSDKPFDQFLPTLLEHLPECAQ